MLTIRQEQVHPFEGLRRQAFEDRMLRYIRSEFPDHLHEFGEPETRLFIERAIKRGAELDIDTESSVAGLIELMIAFGEEFERSPDRVWARRMMANRVPPPDLRLHLMRSRMMATTHGRIVVSHRFPPDQG